MTQTIIFSAIALTLSLSCTGCGLRYVDLDVDTDAIVPMRKDNTPIKYTDDGQILFTGKPLLRGTRSSVVLKYDRLLWWFTRLPFVRTDDKQLLLVDTGLHVAMRVTIDKVVKAGYPVLCAESGSFAYIESLNFDELALQDFIAGIERKTYQFFILGIPRNPPRRWYIGMPLIQQANFIAFNNRAQELTIAFHEFVPDPALSWQSYEFTEIEGRPHVRLMISDVPIELMVDTGGGPKIILDRSQWEALSEHVQIKRHTVSSFPTWGGFRAVDEYVVDRLQLGHVELRNESIWVLQDDSSGFRPLLGLGPFNDVIVVWDLNCNRYWIGSELNNKDR